MSNIEFALLLGDLDQLVTSTVSSTSSGGPISITTSEGEDEIDIGSFASPVAVVEESRSEALTMTGDSSLEELLPVDLTCASESSLVLCGATSFVPDCTDRGLVLIVTLLVGDTTLVGMLKGAEVVVGV